MILNAYMEIPLGMLDKGQPPERIVRLYLEDFSRHAGRSVTMADCRLVDHGEHAITTPAGVQDCHCWGIVGPDV